MKNFSDQELRQLVRAVVAEVVNAPAAKTPGPPPAPARNTKTGQHDLPPPLSRTAIDQIVRASPSRLHQGRAGTRYLTEVYVGLRADHAIALDAVNSSVPDDFAQAQGWLPLKSRCESHEQFLLHPDEGRRLDDSSRAQLLARGEGVDVQIIAGDGLSAYALMQNGPALVPALQQALTQAGFRVGSPLFVRFARIGVADDIGVLVGCKATIILVGERPGLGTGDSLSIYTAYAPRLNQDNSEKDCISNIRPLGHAPDDAARICADLMTRTFAAGGGGVKLVSGSKHS